MPPHPMYPETLCVLLVMALMKTPRSSASLPQGVFSGWGAGPPHALLSVSVALLVMLLLGSQHLPHEDNRHSTLPSL